MARIRISLKFTIQPEEQREEYVEILNDMIRRVVKIINSTRTRTKPRLRAMEVLTDLIRTSNTIIRDVDIERHEREVKTLETEEEGATRGEEEEKEED